MIIATKLFAAAIVLAALTFSSQAHAINFGVKMACASDYYSLCSRHIPGSAGSKQCMRSNGHKLSKRCINALISAGYVSKAYVAKRLAKR